MLVCVYVYICSLFDFLSIPHSCEVALVSVCFSWLSTEILCLSESVDFLSLLDLYLPLFFSVACVYVSL
jgi:hypothetical protein